MQSKRLFFKGICTCDFGHLNLCNIQNKNGVIVTINNPNVEVLKQIELLILQHYLYRLKQKLLILRQIKIINNTPLYTHIQTKVVKSYLSSHKS